ncbi:hypothetical protein KCP77_00860 [Salmonella enterica subsp. enterica]|nr:hypothetical protein KCP77_00860 [Salmonella enterica subsp. enterica]
MNWDYCVKYLMDYEMVHGGKSWTPLTSDRKVWDGLSKIFTICCTARSFLVCHWQARLQRSRRVSRISTQK